ncbi:MAG TPA: hypothetical protein VLE73_03480 [Candidatus Saccharimonadales bacterium]|nr:hypothetical protein [Candidatus Saccharimonadales bacterium]
MGVATLTRKTNTDDFIILGPKLVSGSNALAAVHALYFLPDNYRLVLTGAETADTTLYNKVCALVERDELGGRVEFASMPEQSNAVILPRARYTRARNSVSGDSPEALASAILNVARATA